MLGSSRGFSVIVAAQSAQPRTLPATSDRTNPTHVALPPAFHLGVRPPGHLPALSLRPRSAVAALWGYPKSRSRSMMLS
jgi:hypothetical protein